MKMKFFGKNKTITYEKTSSKYFSPPSLASEKPKFILPPIVNVGRKQGIFSWAPK